MKLLRIALVAALVAGGCGNPPAPTTAGTSSPTPPPTGATATATLPSGEPAAEIQELVAAMEAAVIAGDRNRYLALADLSDPVFELEHTRWADEWSGAHPVADFGLGFSDLAFSNGGATAQLTMTWSLDGDAPTRTATFGARFTSDAGGWRYAGEIWTATDVPHFRILVAPGLDEAVPAIVDDLLSVYDDVTAALGHVPAGSMQLKLYTDAEALVANTLLSLPPILGWNEPGEALKLRVRDDGAPLTPVIAHEFVHFLSFDRAGTQRTRMPWWLDEGIAGFIAEAFEGPVLGDRLDQVVAWQEAGELADWRDMAVFEETPQSLWQFVYPQGYAMVRYVTERYGASERNAWLASMATAMTIDEATPAAFDISFEQLDAGFRQWLGDQ